MPGQDPPPGASRPCGASTSTWPPATTVGMLTTTIAPTAGRARLAGYDVATQPLALTALSIRVFRRLAVS